MKNIFLILTVLCLFSFSSKDDGSSNKENSQNTLIGKWEWTKSTGFKFGGEDTPMSSHKIITLEISNDRIKFVENGQTIFDKSYTIQLQEPLFGKGPKEMIIYEQDSEPRQSFEIKGSELILRDQCFDCLTRHYIKK